MERLGRDKVTARSGERLPQLPRDRARDIEIGTPLLGRDVHNIHLCSWSTNAGLSESHLDIYTQLMRRAVAAFFAKFFGASIVRWTGSRCACR